MLPPARRVYSGLLQVSKTSDQLDAAPQDLAHRSDSGDPYCLSWHLRLPAYTCRTHDRHVYPLFEPPQFSWGGVSSGELVFGLIEGAVSEHREHHVAAAAGQSDQGLVVALALCDLAVVVSPRDRIPQRGKGR
jgi:hypothetical protein